MRNTRRLVILPALAVVALPACLQGPGDDSQQAPVPDLTESTSGALTTQSNAPPTLVASLKVASGNTIEFYDFGGNAMISETGAAYTPPTLNSQSGLRGARVVDVWTALAPNTPIPSALAAFQAQLDSAPATPASGTGHSPGVAFGGQGPQTPSVGAHSQSPSPDAPQGCNNGCCDYAWLATITQCEQTSFDYQWFFYNYGWSYVNASDIDNYNGFACSAVGTSTYSVNMAGHGGAWSVPEATYRTWWRSNTGCFFYCDDLRSSVNTSTNQHLHTYCGFLIYFHW
jgi:hypothetical protein